MSLKPQESVQKTVTPLNLRQQQSAAYLCDMLLELRIVARSMGLRHLTYLIELAIYEAFEVANCRPPTQQDLRDPRQGSRTGA
jgi:hypothetical protein